MFDQERTAVARPFFAAQKIRLPQNMPALLQTKGLAKSYAGPVLIDVNFDLRAAEIHALVGENGAGKSTLCNIIAGLRTADKGEMWIDGVQYTPTNKPIEEAGRR